MSSPSATLAMPDARPAATETGPWREPGQAVDAAYLRDGQLRYHADGHEIVGRNRAHFNNRPLYCRLNTDGAVLTGDRPIVRLIAKPYLYGALTVAVTRGGRAAWLHEWTEVESRYRCGLMTWHCSDPALPGVKVTFTVVPLTEVAGFAAKLHLTGARAGDQLSWSFGGAQLEEGDPRWKWDPVMRGNPDILRSGDPRRPLLFQGMVPEFSANNVATIAGDRFRLAATADASFVAVGRASRSDGLHVGDATTSAELAHRTGRRTPSHCPSSWAP